MKVTRGQQKANKVKEKKKEGKCVIRNLLKTIDDIVFTLQESCKTSAGGFCPPNTE